MIKKLIKKFMLSIKSYLFNIVYQYYLIFIRLKINIDYQSARFLHYSIILIFFFIHILYHSIMITCGKSLYRSMIIFTFIFNRTTKI